MSERPALRPVPGLSVTDLPAPPRRVPATERKTTSNSLGNVAVEPRAAAPAPGRSAVSPWKPTSGGDQTVRAISISLTIPMAEQLKSRARINERPQAQVVLDAILQARHELADLVADRRRSTEWTDELFVRTASAATEPRTAVSLRMLASNVETLDHLVQQTGSSSRSELIGLALQRTA